MKTLAVKEPDIFNIGHGVVLSPVGMTLPDSVDEDQWNEIGDQVMRLGSASNWILGDWWAFGQQAYGERKKWVAEQKAKRAQVKSFQTLRHIAVVCRAYEKCRRRHTISFEMHRELVNLPETKQEKFLDMIEAGEIKTHKELREKVRPAKKHQVRKPVKVEPIIYTTASGKMFQIDDPMPGWHIMTTPRETQQIGCTECWTVFGEFIDMGSLGKMKSPNPNEPWFECKCEHSLKPGFPVKEK
jgi:hypothetical protein